MTRFALLLPLMLAAPATAQSELAGHCEPTTAIVAMAVAERQGGADQVTAATAILEGGAVEALYEPVIGSLVDWVYTIPEDQLSDEVATAFDEACKAN